MKQIIKRMSVMGLILIMILNLFCVTQNVKASGKKALALGAIESGAGQDNQARYMLIFSNEDASDIIGEGVLLNVDGNDKNGAYFWYLSGKLCLFIPYNILETNATTSSKIGEHTVVIKAGSAVGTTNYEIASDVILKINGDSISLEEQKPQLTLGSLESGAGQDTQARYMLIFSNTDASDVIGEGVALDVDGEEKSGAYFWYLSGKLCLFIPYNILETNVTTSSKIGEHTVTIKAGSAIGTMDYEIADDVILKINGDSVSLEKQKPKLTLSTMESGLGQDASSRYMLIFSNTEGSDILCEGVSVDVDGVEKTGAYFWYLSGKLCLFIPYNLLQEDATLSSQIGEHIVTIEAGTTVGATDYVITHDIYIKINGNIVSIMEGYDLSQYRDSSSYTYPTQEGKLFAGWYWDEDLKKPVGANVTTGIAYPKFIDESVLTVKAQVTDGINADSKETDIRFVSTIDSLDYESVGFDILIDGREMQRVSSITVYEKLRIVHGEDVDTIQPTQFSAESKYFFAYAYWQVPSENFRTKFTVTPYYKTLDGTIVQGGTVCKMIASSAILNKEYTYTDDQRIAPFWENGTMYNETMTMLEHTDGSIYGTLLFVPTKINAIVDVGLEKEYIEGIDWEWVEGTNRIKWLESSTIPYFTDYDLSGRYPDGSYISDQDLTEDGRIRFGNCLMCVESFFYEKQICVSYTYDMEQIESQDILYTQYQGDKLQKTISKLTNNQDLNVLFYGDSIFSGCEASSMRDHEPYMPYMHELIEARLQQETTGKVTVDNIAVGGWLSQDGLNALSGTVQGHNYTESYQGYDLLILSFGMNDINTPEADFKSNIRGIVNTIKEANPDLEVVFVSCMNPNPRANMFCGNQQYQGEWYRELASESEYVDITAVVDIYSIHKKILEYKSYSSTTGDNIHHPGDWLIRVYAQNILATMLP